MTKLISGAIVIEGHVQGLANTRSLGSHGIPVVVLDVHDCLARYSKYCTYFYKCPPYGSDALAEYLMNLAEKKNIKDWVLLPSNDHAVLTISRNKRLLEQKFKVITPELEVVQNIYDKARVLRMAEKVNVQIPYFITPNNIDIGEITLKFPVLTKGRQGLDFYKATGKKAYLAYSEAELKRQLGDISKLFDITNTFVQELIPSNGNNRTVSFTAFCDKGDIKTFWMGEKIREHPVRFGTATCAKSVYYEELLGPTQRLLGELNYTGVCEVEYLKDPRDCEYKLIEINARTWLWVELAKACGVDYAKIIFDYLNGISVEYPSDYTQDITWVNYLTDIPYSVLAIFKKQLHFREYLNSLKGKKINAVFNGGDLIPGIMSPFYFLSRLNNR